MTRHILFAVSILIGLIGGLYYGWVVSPVEGGVVAPSLLRADYQTDYVLMVAEAYRADQNQERALERLVFLGAASPLLSTEMALDFAREGSFSPVDLALIEELDAALRAWDPTLETTLTPDP